MPKKHVVILDISALLAACFVTISDGSESNIIGTSRYPLQSPVKEGDTVTFSVTYDTPWENCLWTLDGEITCKQEVQRTDSTGRHPCVTPDPRFAGLVGGDSNRTCSLKMPSVTNLYTGNWQAWALFSDQGHFYNKTWAFQLVTTSLPGVNFTPHDGPLVVKVNTPFSVTCTATNGQPIPIGFTWELVNGDLSAWSPCHSNLIIPDDIDIYSENTSVAQHISLTPGATGDFQLRCTSLQHLDIYKGCGDNCSKTMNVRVTTHGGGGGGTSDLVWYDNPWFIGGMVSAGLLLIFIVVIVILYFAGCCDWDKKKRRVEDTRSSAQDRKISQTRFPAATSFRTQTAEMQERAAAIPLGPQGDPEDYDFRLRSQLRADPPASTRQPKEPVYTIPDIRMKLSKEQHIDDGTLVVARPLGPSNGRTAAAEVLNGDALSTASSFEIGSKQHFSSFQNRDLSVGGTKQRLSSRV